MPGFVLLSFFTALGCDDTLTHMSMADLFRIVQNTFVCKSALQGEEACYLWYQIINMASEVRAWRLQNSGFARYSLTNQLLVQNVMNDVVCRIYGILCAELEVLAEWLLASCDIAERRSHSLVASDRRALSFVATACCVASCP